MLDEFSRTALLLGEENINKLKNTKILVFGIGGVGSHCVQALARCAVGKLVLVDNDEVSITNINRQSLAYHSTIGMKKVDVMKKIIKDINPNADVITHEIFVLKDNLDEIITDDIDYIVDAIDTITAKIAIAQYAQEKNIPLISSMGTGNKLHPEMFEIDDIYKTSVCPLCKVMRKELKKRNIKKLKVLYSKEKPIDCSQNNNMEETKGTDNRPVPASISFVPPVAGLFIAGEVIRDLVKLKPDAN